MENENKTAEEQAVNTAPVSEEEVCKVVKDETVPSGEQETKTEEKIPSGGPRRITPPKQQQQPEQPVTLTRGYTVLVTKSKTPPMPDGNSFWVVNGSEDGGEPTPKLMPITGSMVAVPPNIILCPSAEFAVGLLLHVRDTLMPELSEFSGIELNVVHTEALHYPTSMRITLDMKLFPVQFIPLAAMSINGEPAVKNAAPVADNEKPTTSEDSHGDAVPDGGADE